MKFKKYGYSMIILMFLILICTQTQAQIWLKSKINPFGNISWQYVGENNWIYTKTNVLTGFGFNINLDNIDLKISTNQYGVIDFSVGVTGIAGDITLGNSNNNIKCIYTYNYRWYSGADIDYGYATGYGLSQSVCIELTVPILQ
jgi:hypothetical protein